MFLIISPSGTGRLTNGRAAALDEETAAEEAGLVLEEAEVTDTSAAVFASWSESVSSVGLTHFA